MDELTRQQMLGLLPRLRRFACGLTGSTHDGDDLLQGAVERAIRHIDKWQPGTRLDSWMFQIVRNLHLNEIRASRLRRDRLSALSLEQNSEDGRRVALGKLHLSDVRLALAQLPVEQRAVLLLVCVEGMSYDEVAAVMGVPRGTVGSRLARARMALRALLDSPFKTAAAEPTAQKEPSRREQTCAGSGYVRLKLA
jgi:RNA polymerase sigma-70 factor (ECF subfamily)